MYIKQHVFATRVGRRASTYGTVWFLIPVSGTILQTTCHHKWHKPVNVSWISGTDSYWYQLSVTDRKYSVLLPATFTKRQW